MATLTEAVSRMGSINDTFFPLEDALLQATAEHRSSASLKRATALFYLLFEMCKAQEIVLNELQSSNT